MGASSRPTRTLAPALALVLAAGVLVALASPARAATTTFSQSSTIDVGDKAQGSAQFDDIAIPGSAGGTSGPGAPYPSEMIIEPHHALISDINVRFLLTSEDPQDLDIMLVGPGGQAVMLMSDAGGFQDVVEADLTIDDQASSSVPGTLVSGAGASYTPTNIDSGNNDAFPAPAPTGSGTGLSTFNGTDPSGTWKLFVNDDAAVDVSTIGRWSLNMVTTTNPYPSTIAVTGLPTVTDVNVRLTGFSAGQPKDLDLLLQGPGGQSAVLMSDSGGGSSVNGLDLTIDDEAPSELPFFDPFTSGTYRPTNHSDLEDDSYPGVTPAPSGNTSLSVFDGLSPNGTWRLWAVDDASVGVVRIGGWSLQFTWSDIGSPSGLVSIAGGAGVVGSPNVLLNLNATDPAPASGVQQMRFSNDGATFSAYQPYAASAPWTLTSGSGTKTVYAQFRDADGNQSAVVSDTIVLDQTGPAAKRLKPGKGATGVKPGVKVKITATESLMPGSISKRTAYLKKKGAHGKVRARVSYDPATRTIVIKPRKPLHGKYLVTVAGVQDAVGNAWDQKPGKAGVQRLRYTFTTA